MARRTMARRGRQGPKAKYLWTAVLFREQTVSTAFTDVDILSPVDWERGATSFERATVVAIRGWVEYAPILTTASSVFSYIGLYDEDEASTDADIVAAYQTEDILWTGGAAQGLSTVTTAPGARIDMNVKVSRKITSASQIRFVSSTAAANVWTMSGLLRACVRYT